MIRRVASGLALAAAVFSALPIASGAQTVENLAAACTASGGDATACAATALAGRELIGHLGVLTGAGSELAGESSTLGRRLGGMPRIGMFLRTSGRSAGAPDFNDPTGTGRATSFVPSAQLGLALGVFDGFRIMPTVGGLLSVDLVSQASFMFFPTNGGFDGRVGAFSFGARIGLLRESFTLPGVSVSVARRAVGSLQLGDTDATDRGQVEVDPTVTSYRATVGKDLFALGVMAGIAWDDYSSETALRVLDGGGLPVSTNARLQVDRRIYFFGVSRQIGVLSWVSLELGFAKDFAPVPALTGAVSQSEDLTLVGSLALLLKL